MAWPYAVNEEMSRGWTALSQLHPTTGPKNFLKYHEGYVWGNLDDQKARHLNCCDVLIVATS